MRKPTILSTGQEKTVRDLDASRRLVLGHVQEAVMRCSEGRAALAVGRRSALAGGRSALAGGMRDEGAIAAAFGKIEAALARAEEGLAIQAGILGHARQMVGLDTPENIATDQGRGEGGEAGRAKQQRNSAENREAILEALPYIKGNSTSQRAKGVKMYFQKKAEEAAKSGKRDEMAERIGKLSLSTIEKTVAPPRKAGSPKKAGSRR